MGLPPRSRKRSIPGVFLPVLLCAAACLAAVAPSAGAQTLHTAASDGHTWFLVPDTTDPKGATIVVMHRRAGDEPTVIRQATKMVGTLSTPGLAASGDRLWMVFDNRAVRSLRVIGGEQGPWTRVEPDYEPAMPGPSKPGQASAASPTRFVRSLAAGGESLWALLRVEDAGTLSAIDALPVFDPTPAERSGERPQPEIGPAPRRDGETREPASQPSDGDDTAAGGAAGDATGDDAVGEDAPSAGDAASPTVVRADRLLRLSRTGWQRVPLPADWPNAGPVDPAGSEPAWLVIAPDAGGGDWPRLAVLLNRTTLRVYERDKAAEAPDADGAASDTDTTDQSATDGQPAQEQADAADAPAGDESARDGDATDAAKPTKIAWRQTDYSLTPPAGDAPADESPDRPTAMLPPIIVERQLVVGRRASTETGVHVQLTMLRPGERNTIGTLSLDAPAERWALLSVGPEAALVGLGEDGLLRWSRMNLSGSVTLPGSELRRQAPSPLDWGADLLVLIIVLAAASPVIILLWKRDPSWNKLELPKTLTLSLLGPRVAAAAIDLAPGLAVMMLVFEVPFNELFGHWPGMPGQTPQWQRMIPGAVAIAIYVTHCTAFEAVGGASLGKLMLGLRVRDLKGQPPKLWQILVRNGMKALELVVPFLLILPIMGPYRQRLGDLVARTVVVTPAREDEKEGE